MCKLVPEWYKSVLQLKKDILTVFNRCFMKLSYLLINIGLFLAGYLVINNTEPKGLLWNGNIINVVDLLNRRSYRIIIFTLRSSKIDYVKVFASVCVYYEYIIELCIIFRRKSCFLFTVIFSIILIYSKIAVY